MYVSHMRVILTKSGEPDIAAVFDGQFVQIVSEYNGNTYLIVDGERVAYLSIANQWYVYPNRDVGFDGMQFQYVDENQNALPDN